MSPGVLSDAVITRQQLQAFGVNVEEALDYLQMIKSRFIDQPQVFRDFINIMNEYKLNSSLSIPWVIDQVTNLFNEHPDLAEGFLVNCIPTEYLMALERSEQEKEKANSSESEDFHGFEEGEAYSSQKETG